MDEKIVINKLKCERCGHTWVPRGTVVKTCPSCRSPYWDVPKVNKNAKQSQGEKK